MMRLSRSTTCRLLCWHFSCSRSSRRRGPTSPGRVALPSPTPRPLLGLSSRRGKQRAPFLAALDEKDTKVDMADRMWLSKLLGQFFLVKLAAEVPPSIALINAASPSAIHDSEFNRDFDKTWLGSFIKFILRRLATTSKMGARMITDAIVHHGQETHGHFLSFQKLVP